MKCGKCEAPCAREVITGGPGRSCAWNVHHCTDTTFTRSGRAGDNAPFRAIPVLDEGPGSVAQRFSHRPDIPRRDDGRSEQEAGKRPGDVWTGNDAPFPAIPVFDEYVSGRIFTALRGIVAHRPDVGCRESSDSEEAAPKLAAVGAGDNAPFGAIPVFGECPPPGGTYGPGIVGCVSSNCVEADPAGVRAGDDLPPHTIPMLNEGIGGFGLLVNVVPHGPDVVRGNGRHTAKATVRRAIGCRVGNDLPGLVTSCPRYRL
jgi:hypothetical protein